MKTPEPCGFLFFSSESIRQFMKIPDRPGATPGELPTRMNGTPCGGIFELAREITRGRLVVYPTDTIYGLGTTIHSPVGTRGVYSLKNRPLDLPLSLCVPSRDAISQMAEPNELALRLMDSFLPGPLTLVLRARDSFWKDLGTAPFFVKNGKLGIRYLPDPFFNALLKLTGPISTTSANIHNAADPGTLEEIIGRFSSKVHYYLFWNSPFHTGKVEDWMREEPAGQEKGESYLYGDGQGPDEINGCDDRIMNRRAPQPLQTNHVDETRKREEAMKNEDLSRKKQRSSTVVEILDDDVCILREGVIPQEMVEEKLHG